MPIFMDRHEVSNEVTAEIVADLHQKDLKIQHKFHCKGLSYWFDDKRKTAFCLVEAPNKEAIKKMHDHAHGEVPHKIIEVDRAVVESFLGRIEDPEKSVKTELNIINDPAFRTLMVVEIIPSTLKGSSDKELNSAVLEYKLFLHKIINNFNGRIIKQNGRVYLNSFLSVTHAVSCALEIQKEFKRNTPGKFDSLLKLNIGLSAGIPVSEKEGIYEDAIQMAQHLSGISQGGIFVTSEVRDLYESENLNVPIDRKYLKVLSLSNEKFLIFLMDYIHKEWNSPSLNMDNFSKCMGYSKSQLYRKMVSITGLSPNTFIKIYRMNKALNLLHKKNKHISEVAFETGFNSPAYFSKCFQETFGILPSNYIKIFDF